MAHTTHTPVEGVDSHVCPHCGHLHETVPACRTCDQWGEMRAYWLQVGKDQGYLEAREEHRPHFEALLNRLREFEGEAAKSVSKVASGPSYADLQARRYGGV